MIIFIIIKIVRGKIANSGLRANRTHRKTTAAAAVEPIDVIRIEVQVVRVVRVVGAERTRPVVAPRTDIAETTAAAIARSGKENVVTIRS